MTSIIHITQDLSHNGCPTCGHITGFHSFPVSDTCPQCGDSGQCSYCDANAMVEGEDGTLRPCPYCVGKVCTKCHGEGFVRNYSPNCPECARNTIYDTSAGVQHAARADALHNAGYDWDLKYDDETGDCTITVTVPAQPETTEAMNVWMPKNEPYTVYIRGGTYAAALLKVYNRFLFGVPAAAPAPQPTPHDTRVTQLHEAGITWVEGTKDDEGYAVIIATVTSKMKGSVSYKLEVYGVDYEGAVKNLHARFIEQSTQPTHPNDNAQRIIQAVRRTSEDSRWVRIPLALITDDLTDEDFIEIMQAIQRKAEAANKR